MRFLISLIPNFLLSGLSRLYFPDTTDYRIYRENNFQYFIDQYEVFDLDDSEFLGFRTIRIIIFWITSITEFTGKIIFHNFYYFISQYEVFKIADSEFLGLGPSGLSFSGYRGSPKLLGK